MQFSHTREHLAQLCKLPAGQLFNSRLLVGQLVTWVEMKKTEVKAHLHSKRGPGCEFGGEEWHWWSTAMFCHSSTGTEKKNKSGGTANGKCPVTDIWPGLPLISQNLYLWQIITMVEFMHAKRHLYTVTNSEHHHCIYPFWTQDQWFTSVVFTSKINLKRSNLVHANVLASWGKEQSLLKKR